MVQTSTRKERFGPSARFPFGVATESSRSGLELQRADRFSGGVPHRDVSDRHKIGPHHVYNRGRCGRNVFLDDADRDEFRDLIASRLRDDVSVPRRYRKAAQVSGIEIVAQCLMTSHYHLVVWQHRPGAMTALMQSVTTSYVRYFNNRHGSAGQLFDGPFRSRSLEGLKDLRWCIGYVHDNHPSGLDYRYSTHRAYLDESERPPWLNTAPGLAAFGGVEENVSFLNDRDERDRLNRKLF